LLKLPAAPVVLQKGRATQQQSILRLPGGRRLLEADKRGAVMCPIHLECGDAVLWNLNQLRVKSGPADPMQEPVRDLPVSLGDLRLRLID
jgi:hypothetical protein